MSQNSLNIRKGKTRILWVWKMRNDHYGVRRKHGKWGMKQDSTAWKFRTQKSNGIIYSDFEDKFRALSGAHYIHTIYSFWSSGSQESNASNGVQIGAEMKKLWPFADNCTKLEGHFEMISKFNLWSRNSTYEFKIHFEMTLISNSPTATLMFHLIYLGNCI